MQHKTRIWIVTASIVLSFGIIALCCFYNDVEAMFYVSLLASIIVGIGCALGESVNLGFLKTFPGNGIGYYGSGTGLAGITGAVIFIALKPCGLSDAAIYLIALPTAIPYIMCFLWLDRQKKKYPYIAPPEEQMNDDSQGSIDGEEVIERVEAVKVGLDDMTTTTISKLPAETANLEEEGVVDNKGFTKENMGIVLGKVGHIMANLALVYFLEYTITTAFTVACAEQIKDLKKGRDKEFTYENSYVIFNLCYQVGVFMSRSSLSFVKIKRVWIITIA